MIVIGSFMNPSVRPLVANVLPRDGSKGLQPYKFGRREFRGQGGIPGTAYLIGGEFRGGIPGTAYLIG
jgi:hypothetical protein